jgi:predicted unusual protein kinase regulating ubiquinone biosynthesis (AarF/ABC1/UbiB family)
MLGAGKTWKIAKLAVTVPMYPLMPSKQKYARWLRGEVEKAGCLYVKIGQWVSSRTDVFPPEITQEFAALRAGSAPMDAASVISAVGSIPDLVVDDLPVSTGSIAQVHRGTYRGRDVAVKIQRPDLLRQLVHDVDAVKFVLGFIRVANRKMYDDLVSSLDDLIDTVTRELDFEAEAGHMRRFLAFFDASFVKIPNVVVATPGLIVMEFIESEPYRGSASALMELFFRQFFELGWLHTDMHEGNLAQTADGQLVLFDFGSVLEIPDEIRLCIKHLMVSYLNRNVSIMLDYMLEYGLLVGATPGKDEREMLEAFLENVLEYVEITDMSRFTEVMKAIPVYQTPNTVFRSEIFLIMRSFTLMEGLCKSLDPSFVILDAVTPLTEYFTKDPMLPRLKIEDDIRATLQMFTRRIDD